MLAHELIKIWALSCNEQCLVTFSRHVQPEHSTETYFFGSRTGNFVIYTYLSHHNHSNWLTEWNHKCLCAAGNAWTPTVLTHQSSDVRSWQTVNISFHPLAPKHPTGSDTEHHHWMWSSVTLSVRCGELWPPTGWSPDVSSCWPLRRNTRWTTV